GHAGRRSGRPSRRAKAARYAGEVSAAPQVRRRGLGGVGQRVAASLGDAHRSRGPAYTLAYHHQGGEEIMRRILFAALAAMAAPSFAQMELHGASQFNDDHAFTKALVRFQELVDKYSGTKSKWVLHKNSELGLEKQYFEYMAQGKAVDYAIVSPAHM